ncbi:GNAT family N-acetyltransferase, partial [Vibrio cholerae]|nr:GNAT family N-acetyltransferase [Vibrio cholerae]
MEIKEISSTAELENDLASLLIDCVESGASVGFLTPISHQDVESYWAG